MSILCSPNLALSYSKKLIMILLTSLTMGFILSSTVHASISQESATKSDKFPQPLKMSRANHARELLGRSYVKKASKENEQSKDVIQFVKESTRRFLPKKFKKQSAKIADTLLAQARKYEFDPLFLMAVILNESSFHPERSGAMGEVGLMQIFPKNAEWIAKKYQLDYLGEDTLKDPSGNIKIGAAMLDQLRRSFDSDGQLYLSAYNIGARKVRKMVQNQTPPKLYVLAVMKRYIALYQGFKFNGNPKKQSEVAWVKTNDLTRSPARDASPTSIQN
jgi:hypothetical protein